MREVYGLATCNYFAFEIAREHDARNREENERENSKKIFHESREWNVLKHCILTMRSGAVSSPALGFSLVRCNRSELTRYRASDSIVATIKSVRRSVLLLAAASSSFAQVAPVAPQPAKTPPLQAAAPQPARPAPSVPRVVRTPAPPPQTPAPVAPASPQPGAPQMLRLQFPNSDVTHVLHLYEQLTGNKLLTANFVQCKINIFI